MVPSFNEYVMLKIIGCIIASVILVNCHLFKAFFFLEKYIRRLNTHNRFLQLLNLYDQSSLLIYNDIRVCCYLSFYVSGNNNNSSK